MKIFALLSGLALLVILAMPTHVAAQATVGTGSIQGTVLDPNGASGLRPRALRCLRRRSPYRSARSVQGTSL